MQRAIKKEAGDNYLKRIVVAFLAVIMMTTMLRPSDSTGSICRNHNRVEGQ